MNFRKLIESIYRIQRIQRCLVPLLTLSQIHRGTIQKGTGKRRIRYIILLN